MNFKKSLGLAGVLLSLNLPIQAEEYCLRGNEKNCVNFNNSKVELAVSWGFLNNGFSWGVGSYVGGNVPEALGLIECAERSKYFFPVMEEMQKIVKPSDNETYKEAREFCENYILKNKK